MPKIYADGIKLIKKRSKWWFVPFVVVLVLFVVFLGQGISSLLHYGNLKLFGTSSGSYTLYALSFGSFDSYDKASEFASKLSVHGAGAYIMQKDNAYSVLGCVYPTQEDANKVLKSMQEYNCTIVELNYPKVSFSASNFSKDERQSVVSACEYLKSVYSTMYDNVIKLDMAQITNIACSNNLSYLKSECKTIVAKLMKINSKYNNAKIGQIINGYIVIIDSIDNCISNLISSTKVGYVAKYALCEVCVEMQKMYKAL